jgi:RNA recognition motif. (a.k.a. RRM, RBD, or RNP domain)
MISLQTREADVRRLLAPARTFVWSVSLPTGADGRGRGFGFASFTSQPDAARTLAAVNGAALRGRPVAVDWALGKTAFQELAGASGGAHAAAAAAATTAAGKEEDSGGSSGQSASEEGDEDEGDDDGVSQSSDGVNNTENESDAEAESDGGGEDGEAGEDEDAEERAAVASALHAVLSSGKQQQQQKQEDLQQSLTGAAAAAREQHDAVATSQDQKGTAGPSLGKGNQQDQQMQKLQQEKLQSERRDGAAPGVADGDGSSAVTRTVFVRGVPPDATGQELKASVQGLGIEELVPNNKYPFTTLLVSQV